MVRVALRNPFAGSKQASALRESTTAPFSTSSVTVSV
jgi:hypothetical protein